MDQIHRNWLADRGAVIGTLLALPVAVLAVWLIHRRRGGPLRYAIAEVGMVFGTLPWLYLTLRPDPDGMNLVFVVPFQDLADLASRGIVDLVTQTVGNLLVFAALGCFLPVRFAGFTNVWRVLAVGALASSAIEFTQLIGHFGRVFSVDDIMINAIGAALAALCSRPWWASRDAPLPAATTS
jgi:hypothetical protein